MSELEPVATVGSSVVNLLNTIVGAGLLAVPLTFKTDGVLLGVLIIVLAGLTSGFGLYLQGLTSKFIDRGNANFFNICLITYPSLSVLFDVAIAIQCFGVGVSYVVLIGDLMPTILQFEIFGNEQRLFWILFSALIITPLCFFKNLDSLKYTSIIALASIGYIVLLIYIHFFMELKLEIINGLKSDLKGDISLLKPESFNSILSTFAIIVFAFTGHQNMYSIINELKVNTTANINKIVVISIFLTAMLFLTVGLTGYYTFGNNINGNIILIYTDNAYTKLARLSIVIMVLLSFPLMLYPCRISIHNIVSWVNKNVIKSFWTTTTTNNTATVNTNFPPDETSGLLEEQRVGLLEAEKPVLNHARFVTLTVILLLLSYIIAISLTSFEFILSVVGATGSTAISFILPGLFGYKLIGSEDSLGMLREQVDGEDEAIFKNKIVNKLSLGLTAWGIIVMVLCLYSSIYLE
ncbi:hypothetical protein PACTADRAFT_1635 [Pachysolen tannophilus NRRL Y-2460]|uniref:Amino acid transporter transmembrane domain-containing protein n=1 Tax=Pachysolen tannophilus NRRL Y-2460 TaxID=669874 RepID=A0A1E4TZ69_PACTA|nr:hypothetical protein PACTADRAFT_1635 [Pachysolen tannophilus NRRL Y-2460]